MRLSHNDKDELLKRLPTLKLSYENIHKKVSSEMYFLIPKGKKHLVWFTYFQDKKVCIFVEMNAGVQKSISNMYIVPQMFEKRLVLGTILYGTVFLVNGNSFFSVENIHFYKGKNVENNNELFKLTLLKKIFDKELKQSVVTNNGICLGMPIIENSFEKAINCVKQLPYEIYSIQNRNFDDNKCIYQSTLYKSSSLEEENKIFLIKPDIQNDIYHLYVKNKYNSLEKYDIAAIPDYKTSVMMNKIFRNIKENRNLDALEESDDDEEFENISEDKFVKLDKTAIMECSFNKRGNTYIPLKIVERGIIASLASLEASQQRLEQTNTRTNRQGQQYNQQGHRPQYNQQGHRPQYNQQGHRPQYNQQGQRPQYNQTGQKPQYNQTGQKPQYNQHRQNNHYRQSFNQ